jgi:hypothetical protein
MTQLPRSALRRLGISAAVSARSFAAKVAAGAAVVVLALAVGSPTALAESQSPRSGVLSLTKECSQFHGQAGGFCTITSSDLKVIRPGSRVIYTKAAGATGLDTDIVLYTGPGNSAFGHVVLDFATGTGTVTLNGGTGHFRHFHARAAVTFIGGVNWAWNGTYRFSPHD